MRILVADRLEKVRHALSILLDRQEGWVVIGIAEDAAGLLAIVANDYPDLILLDWNLPGIANLQLLRRLRKLCPQMAIIAMSGRPELRQEAVRAGVDDFISKADSPARLLETIRAHQNNKAYNHRAV